MNRCWLNIPDDENDKSLKNFLKDFQDRIGIEEVESVDLIKRDEDTIKISHRGYSGLDLYIRLIKEKNKAILIRKDARRKVYIRISCKW